MAISVLAAAQRHQQLGAASVVLSDYGEAAGEEEADEAASQLGPKGDVEPVPARRRGRPDHEQRDHRRSRRVASRCRPRCQRVSRRRRRAKKILHHNRSDFLFSVAEPQPSQRVTESKP